MAYQEYTISTVADIPGIVATFAAGMGWNVQAGPILRHPNFNGAGPGGLAFALTASINPPNHELKWTCTTDASRGAGIRSPIFATLAQPDADLPQLPTKLYLIGMLTPEPYIAIVVEYGYNLYRHLYLGYMEKQGDYTGGAVCGAVNGPPSKIGSDLGWLDVGNTQTLFRGHVDPSYPLDNSYVGGVEVISPENASTWRRFADRIPLGSQGQTEGIASGVEAYGGFGDGFNEPYVAKGKNRIAGANVLVPINLYISRLITGNWRAKGIGRPAGVRMLNIQDIDPQASFDVGGETFYSFAARAKNALAQDARPGNAGFRRRLYETSYFLGYAYRG